MTLRPARAALAATILAALLAPAPTRAENPITAPAPTPPGRWHDASLDEYRTHLQDLIPIVAACAATRDQKTCDPNLIGPDDRIPLTTAANAERRLIRYGWLRVLFSKAQSPKNEDKDPSPPKSDPQKVHPASDDTALPPPPTTTQLLADAQTRLAHDLAQAGTLASASPANQPATQPAHQQQRSQMTQVLAGRDFRAVAEPSPRETLAEQINSWLNQLFDSAQRFAARSPWIGRAVIGGFIFLICIGLVWGLLQLERRWRGRLVPDQPAPQPGAASARDWQLWLDDARRAAASGQWREAVHFVYWAAISRLESRRLWPADRARTPREYLALVAPNDPRKPRLATLTRSFERIWYGGRPAAESDYRAAEQLANALISGSAAPAAESAGGPTQ
ncbi:MAG: DUF4129 domain-containing protein [Terracidiphilus sp.]